jgi:hypothetical protein
MHLYLHPKPAQPKIAHPCGYMGDICRNFRDFRMLLAAYAADQEYNSSLDCSPVVFLVKITRQRCVDNLKTASLRVSGSIFTSWSCKKEINAYHNHKYGANCHVTKSITVHFWHFFVQKQQKTVEKWNFLLHTHNFNSKNAYVKVFTSFFVLFSA